MMSVYTELKIKVEMEKKKNYYPINGVQMDLSKLKFLLKLFFYYTKNDKNISILYNLFFFILLSFHYYILYFLSYFLFFSSFFFILTVSNNTRLKNIYQKKKPEVT